MEKINIADLLRDCPQGMELDCVMYEDCKFLDIDAKSNNYLIRITTPCGIKYLDKYGCYTTSDKSKCVIFPKGKTTWEGFHKPFKDGDIIATDLGSIFILKSCLEDKIHYHSYFGVTCCNEIQEKQIPFAYKDVCHLATEEEKQKLFQAIKDSGYRWNSVLKTLEKLPIFNDGDIIYNRFHKVIGIYHSKEDESPCVSHCRYNEFHKTFEILNEDLHIAKQDYRLASNDEKQKFFDVIKAHGYKWNPEVKTLEKLHKFKVGDRVKHISAHTPGVVLKVGDKGYYIDLPKNGGVRYISFELEKDYELLPNKFDINTLVPFESRVLVRDTKEEKWKPSIWGYYDANNTEYYPYEIVGGNCFCFCIPYEGNEHLLGTTNDCDDFYKTWKK